MKVFDCGVLVDGESDDPVRDAVVVVEDGWITGVGPREAVTVPDDAERIDHSDGVVLPGLIDAHIHLGGWRSSDLLT
jgi:imidazolonepropionase-like amidohydrolase